MPKIIYTFDDVVALISVAENVSKKSVKLYGGSSVLSIGNEYHGDDVEQNDPIFEIDCEASK